MTHSGTWKKAERDIGEMFGAKRNVLSGANNTTDDNKPRPGDVIHPELIEVKLRQGNAAITRALDTAQEAKRYGKQWVHIELLKGTRAVFGIHVDKDTAWEIARFLNALWHGKRLADKTEGFELSSVKLVTEYKCLTCGMIHDGPGLPGPCLYCSGSKGLLRGSV